MADSALLISSIFLIFAAVYSAFTILSQLWLFRAINLPFSYLAQVSDKKGMREIYRRAVEVECREIYWTWWGHEKSPVGHIFVVIAFISGIIGVGVHTFFSPAVLKLNRAGSSRM